MVEINGKATSLQLLSTSVISEGFSASKFPVSHTATLCIDLRIYNKF